MAISAPTPRPAGTGAGQPSSSCFNKILSFLRSKAIAHPDHPAPKPVIAPKYEAQFNQLVSYLGPEDFVGLVGMQFCLDSCSPEVTLSHNKNSASILVSAALSSAGGVAACNFAPTMQSGKVYHVRCEFETLESAEGLFFGVASSSQGSNKALLENGVGEKSRVLTGCKWKDDPEWRGWQESEQYLLKIDLVNRMLHVRCSKAQKEFQVPIVLNSKCSTYICLFTSRQGYTKIKLLPVLSQDILNY